MQLMALWPLVLLLFIPFIIILYLLKQKAEDYRYSSTYLWKEVYKNIEATTPWEKLKNNLLMYLQILTMLILILALAKPYLTKGGSEYKNVVIVIDNSGSMQNMYEDKSRFDTAITRATEYIDSIKGGASITIISAANSAKIEVANTTDKAEAISKLKLIKSTDVAGDASSSITLVSAMAKQWESYEAIFFTDKGMELKDINGVIVNLYKELPNASVDYVSHVINEDGLTALVKITNRSDYVIESDVNLYGNNNLLDVKSVVLDAGESKVLYFEDVNFSGDIIKAELNEKDSLDRDNVAYDIVKNVGVKNVLLVTDKNLFLEKAIATIPNIELYKTNDADIDSSDSFDLYIFDGMMPDSIPNTGNIVFINPSSNEMFKVDKKVDGGIITTVSNPVTKYIENVSFGVNRFSAVKIPVWANSFMEYDEHSAGFIGDYMGRVVAVIGFDLHQTDLPLKSEFPVLIHNLVSQMVDTGIIEKKSYMAGEAVSLNPIANGSEVEVTKPDGSKEAIPVRFPMKNFSNTESVGVYRVSQVYENEVREGYFSVGFPSEQESSMVSGENESVGMENVRGSLRGGKDLQDYLIVIIIVMLCVEWGIYIKVKSGK